MPHDPVPVLAPIQSGVNGTDDLQSAAAVQQSTAAEAPSLQQSVPATQFSVNGNPVSISVDTATPLLYVLRNDLQLKGTRFGCGAGNCGSCTVMLDGHAVPSCDTPLWAAAGREITTVEGLGTAQHPHAVQQAFLDLQAAQCGYCINGIMIAIAALLKKTPEPSDDELRAALERHLCRCGTHMRILQAARRAVELTRADA